MSAIARSLAALGFACVAVAAAGMDRPARAAETVRVHFDETAIVFFAGQALETAAADSARLIMTGQAQNAGYDQAKFKEAVCGKIYGLFNCNGGLSVDVKRYPSFASIPLAKPITNGNVDTNTGYQPGDPGNIVVVRMMYQWPVYVSLLGLNLADVSGGKRLLMSTVAFRNEPYK